MKNARRLILIICIFASASSHAALAQRLIIQFSEVLTAAEQTVYQRKINELAPAGFEIIKSDRRWILVLPSDTTPEQITAIADQLSHQEKVNFVERDLPMKKLLLDPG